MKILLATSEAVPFAKTGGLGDMAGSLPVALEQLGHEPAVILPAYRRARECGMRVEPLGIDFIVPIASKTMTGHLLESRLPGSKVPVYLVQQEYYYDREGLYGEGGRDYNDNCERFVFFSRAVLEAVRLLELDLDVLHANDWQTGLVPPYLKIEYKGHPRYDDIASLLTVHNIAYQGQFWHWDMLLTGLDWKYFNWHQVEFFGKLNLLKAGLVFADAISTVSRRYADEVQTADFGAGLEGVLRHRQDVLTGIPGGIDPRRWNPADDPLLAVNYTDSTVGESKPVCKADLQRAVGLAERPDVPLVGLLGPLSREKGTDLVAEVLPRWAGQEDVQWVILGTGEPGYQRLFEEQAVAHPEKVAFRLTLSDELTHRVVAGADLLLVPSRVEPCGRMQMVAQRYGTVPLVRRTGGLADTVIDVDEKTLVDRTATGFCFSQDNPQALGETLRRARDAYSRPAVWAQLVQTAMKEDWSWSRSAREYIRLYERMMERAKQAAGTVAT